MQLRQRHQFTTIRTEGSILPADLLQRINEREAGAGRTEARRLSPPRQSQTQRSHQSVMESPARRLDGLPLGAGEAAGHGSCHHPDAREMAAARSSTNSATGDCSLPGRLSLTAEAIRYRTAGSTRRCTWLARVLIERTAGVAGAARMSPHGLVQELLNRSEAHLWGMVSNGLAAHPAR